MRHFANTPHRNGCAARNVTQIIYSLTLAILLAVGGCKKQASIDVSQPPEETPTPVDAISSSPAINPAPAPDISSRVESVVSRIDGTIALQRAQTICSLGARSYATPGYRQTLAWLRSELTRLGWHTVFQAFDSKTAVGDRTYTNLIATWPGPETRSNRVILSAHYDSRGSKITQFPQASEGAAGCGVLLELAERLTTAPDLASRMELVFFDGEEPTQQISANDGLAGSRFYLQTLTENNQIPNYRALLNFGAIGHTGARWTIPIMTNPLLNQTIKTLAFKRKWEGQIIPLEYPVWGAHLPALQAGLPATYLHDALYPALGTQDDTPDKLSAVSLERSAIAGLEFLKLPPLEPK